MDCTKWDVNVDLNWEYVLKEISLISCKLNTVYFNDTDV